jgi:hypothetical protein
LPQIPCTLGGAPVYPYQPDKVWESLAITNERDFTYPASHGPDLWRRSLYTFWRRTVQPTNFFDTSQRQNCRVRVPVTGSPLHALVTLNDPTYVEAARAIGAGHLRILLRHVLVNSMAPILVQLTFVFALAVLAEAVLSFIGVGPRPPTPTFGNVIADGRNYLAEAPWICAAPGIAVMTLVIGLNLLGDGLRDVLDPRLRLELR